MTYIASHLPLSMKYIFSFLCEEDEKNLFISSVRKKKSHMRKLAAYLYSLGWIRRPNLFHKNKMKKTLLHSLGFFLKSYPMWKCRKKWKFYFHLTWGHSLKNSKLDISTNKRLKMRNSEMPWQKQSKFHLKIPSNRKSESDFTYRHQLLTLSSLKIRQLQYCRIQVAHYIIYISGTNWQRCQQKLSKSLLQARKKFPKDWKKSYFFVKNFNIHHWNRKKSHDL